MRPQAVWLVVLGVLFSRLHKSFSLKTDEAKARKFALKINERMQTYLNAKNRDLFDLFENYEANISQEFVKIMKRDQTLVDIVDEAKAFDFTQFQDEELRYVFEKIRKCAAQAVAGLERYESILNSSLALSEVAFDKETSAYRNKPVKLSYLPDIRNVIATSSDLDEMKYYWTAWRGAHAWTIIDVREVVKVLREVAKRTDMTPYDFWMREHNITEMENVMSQIEPLYKQLHAFIRKQLLAKYGDQAIKPNGPIPDHLFQQVLAQAWTNGSIIDEIYPHKDLPPYDSILEKNKYDTLKLYKTADKFYQTLGFEPIPDSLWNTQIKMNKDEDEGDCKATIFDLTSNVYMQYCQKMDFRKFLQAHGYMGQLYYAREKKALPAYYFSSYNLEYPLGEAVVLSASTPKYLKAIGMVTDFQFTDEVLMNRLLRMGIHTLLNIPVYFVHTKVMADLFADVVSIDHLNKHYWKLMDKYVGVEPPVDRHTDFFDFPFKFYIDLNENTQAKKFNTEVLGYQFYQKFCEISRQYPGEPLHNCDFHDNTSVGDAMKKMMKLGSSKEFPEVLAALLPENPSANAASLLEYYQPVKTWLTDKNHEANVKIGWTPSDKNIV